MSEDHVSNTSLENKGRIDAPVATGSQSRRPTIPVPSRISQSKLNTIGDVGPAPRTSLLVPPTLSTIDASPDASPISPSRRSHHKSQPTEPSSSVLQKASLPPPIQKSYSTGSAKRKASEAEVEGDKTPPKVHRATFAPEPRSAPSRFPLYVTSNDSFVYQPTVRQGRLALPMDPPLLSTATNAPESPARLIHDLPLVHPPETALTPKVLVHGQVEGAALITSRPSTNLHPQSQRSPHNPHDALLPDVASPKPLFPSQPSSHHTHLPSRVLARSICETRASRRRYRAHGGPCLFLLKSSVGREGGGGEDGWRGAGVRFTHGYFLLDSLCSLCGGLRGF